jgi:hypothetical protein
LSISLYLYIYKDFVRSEAYFKKMGDISMVNFTITMKACFIGFLFYGLTQVTITRKEVAIIMSFAIILKILSKSLYKNYIRSDLKNAF